MSNTISQQGIARSLMINKKTNFEIPLNEILLLQGDANYTNFVFLGRNKYMIAHSLKHFEAELLTKGFVRLHRSYLVNKLHILQTNSQDSTIVLTDGRELQVARRRIKELKNL